jgi:RES domain-containing protein
MLRDGGAGFRVSAELTRDWRQVLPRHSARTICLLVPSAVVPEEFNLLINPSHSDFKDLQFSEPAEFNFDPRMWK